MKQRRFIIVCVCFVICINTPLIASVQKELSVETLYYTLSYRGLLTSMIWADLADIKITSLQNKGDEQKNQFFELFLSTEHYKKAELFHPVRYTYRSTTDHALQKTLFIEEEDTGSNQSYDVLWLDWQKKSTHLFTQCKKQSDCSIIKSLPDTLLVNKHNIPLSYKELGDQISTSQVLDPLSLLYFLRRADLTDVTKISLVVGDDIRLYQIRKQAVDILSLNGKKMSATEYTLHAPEKKDHYYSIWLSNDPHKLPLRMSMDAPLGKLKIDLIKTSPL